MQPFTRSSSEFDPVVRRGDVRLPQWGPYTKAYAGISHLPDLDSGMRFDLSVFPSFYRRRQVPPNVSLDTGCYAWQADVNLREFTFRHVLDGVETLFADMRFVQREDANGCDVRVRLVNRTAISHQLALHFVASIAYPNGGPGNRPPICSAKVELPKGGQWIDGLAYEWILLHEDSHERHLPDNADIWGEVRGDGFVGGTGLGRGFGANPTDRVRYAMPTGIDARTTVAMMRLRMLAGERTQVFVNGAYAGAHDVEGSGDFQCLIVPAGEKEARGFEVTTSGGAAIEIDGFALIDGESADTVRFRTTELNHRATVHAGTNGMYLEYAPIPGVYAVRWPDGDSRVREWFTDAFDFDFAHLTHEHVLGVIDRGGRKHYTEAAVRPILLRPGEEREVAGFVGHAISLEAAERMLRIKRDPSPRRTGRIFLPPHTDAGKTFAYGVARLAAVVATNITYPQRRLGRFIRHYCPGRWWDSLYTWDAGFIGLGLLELDPERSIDNLAAYLSEDHEDIAYAHHGSPVPVQIYQLHALWNGTQDHALLRRFFPGARRMHRFLMGRAEGSTTRTLGSGLLRTWDYFYNSGGWDDYPPQHHVRGTPLTNTVTPVVNSAHAIRTAKLLCEMASLLGEDTAEFGRDVTELSNALQTHSWEAESGWFSYVRHDENGLPLGPLRHESGEDFNRGFDGIYPLVSGICTPEQERRFLARLKDEKVFRTACGLSTVDQSASYFRRDGYWNGAVWFPHQWFLWKTLLDLGEGELAWWIAQTALQTWEREVRATGCSFEHFVVGTGRGAGWHQFSGLSAPVLSWFAACYRPGRITGGYDCWIIEQRGEHGRVGARLRLCGDPSKSPVVFVVASEGSRANWKGAPVPVVSVGPSTLLVRLPRGADEGELCVA